MKEVAAEPDIMGDLREDIEDFYKRDHVEVVEEKEMVEHIFFTDLNFSHNTRVSQVRWHPTIEGMVVTIVEFQAWDKKFWNFHSKQFSVSNTWVKLLPIAYIDIGLVYVW